MANDVRRNADAMEAITPIAAEQHIHARDYMPQSNLAAKVQETLQAFDILVKYHVTNIRNFCNDTDFIAGIQEDLDRQIAAGITEAGPR